MTGEMLTFRAMDFYIAEVDDRESGLKKEVIRLKSELAFDEGMIEEFKLKGVRKWVEKPTE